jgi:hypothetical protein
VFGDLNDPQSAVRQLLDKEKLVRIIGPHSNTQPNIYYHEGTQQLDWAVSPTLPGKVHMPSAFWKTD